MIKYSSKTCSCKADKFSLQPSLLTNPQTAGKVTYGEKRKAGGGSLYQGHAAEISQSVKELYELERKSQNSFISLRFNTPVRS